jgi:hypothetical protein
MIFTVHVNRVGIALLAKVLLSAPVVEPDFPDRDGADVILRMLVENSAVAAGPPDFHDALIEDCGAATASVVVNQQGDLERSEAVADAPFDVVHLQPIPARLSFAEMEADALAVRTGLLQNRDDGGRSISVVVDAVDSLVRGNVAVLSRDDGAVFREKHAGTLSACCHGMVLSGLDEPAATGRAAGRMTGTGLRRGSRDRRDGLAMEMCPILTKLPPQLTHPSWAHPKPLSHVQRPLADHQLRGEPTIPIVERLHPLREIDPESSRIRRGRDRVVRQGVGEGVAGQGAVVGQLLDHEVMTLLGTGVHHVLGLLHPRDPPPATDGLDGEGRDGGDELRGVLAPFFEPEEPFPAQSDGLGDPISSQLGAADATKADPGMSFDPGQECQEARLETICGHGKALWDRPHGGGPVFETRPPSQRASGGAEQRLCRRRLMMPHFWREFRCLLDSNLQKDIEDAADLPGSRNRLLPCEGRKKLGVAIDDKRESLRR